MIRPCEVRLSHEKMNAAVGIPRRWAACTGGMAALACTCEPLNTKLGLHRRNSSKYWSLVRNQPLTARSTCDNASTPLREANRQHADFLRRRFIRAPTVVA